MMKVYVCHLNTSESVKLSEVGGKAGNLIALAKIEHINLPKGFCLKTNAYAELFHSIEMEALLNELSQVKIGETTRIREVCTDIRNRILNATMSKSLLDEIGHELERIGTEKYYAIRSSGTAEDLPNASFAGQYDTFLNIKGMASIIEHIRLCWASLFTERAVIYRLRSDFDHTTVKLAVIVQEMIHPDASGIMFTADPNTSNRKVVSIDASYGLGEAIVSGMVNADSFKVREHIIIQKTVSDKKRRINPVAGGGISTAPVSEENRKIQAISDDTVLELEHLGRRIEDCFSYPQDIEWCVDNKKIVILQSRPITTLFPLPEVKDGNKHIYLSAGHLQMMTAPIKPLGMSFFRMALGDAPYAIIGGRLYNDITHDLTTPQGRLMAKSLLNAIGDQLMTDAIRQVIKDKQLIRSLPKGKDKTFKTDKMVNPIAVIRNMVVQYKKNDPDLVQKLVDREDKSIHAMHEHIRGLSGTALMDFIYDDHTDRRFKIIQPDNAAVLAVAMITSLWLNRIIRKNLGIKNAADTILMSIVNSVSTDTGMALLDVADVVRKYPDVMDYFEHPDPVRFYKDLEDIEGGDMVTASFRAYLSTFGMRCSGDIDITVPRWLENPTSIVPLILNNISNFEPDARQRLWEEGIREYDKKINDWEASLKHKFGGRRKANRIRKNAEVIRNYIGYREYPKFSYMKRYFIYKQAMLEEASRLVSEGVINQREDIYYLSLDELMEVVETRTADQCLISTRKAEYQTYEKLTPQRIMMSDGDVISGSYNTADMPEGALPGVPVSAGIISGRARVIHDMAKADFEEGDILVTKFTDPSWTPVFVSVKGLITEVGGLATHGAVIAREYGLPAVVSVVNATRLIQDGQRIRLNGTEGYVEFL